jgi:hypothetical protein
MLFKGKMGCQMGIDAIRANAFLKDLHMFQKSLQL